MLGRITRSLPTFFNSTRKMEKDYKLRNSVFKEPSPMSQRTSFSKTIKDGLQSVSRNSFGFDNVYSPRRDSFVKESQNPMMNLRQSATVGPSAEPPLCNINEQRKCTTAGLIKLKKGSFVGNLKQNPFESDQTYQKRIEDQIKSDALRSDIMNTDVATDAPYHDAEKGIFDLITYFDTAIDSQIPLLLSKDL